VRRSWQGTSEPLAEQRFEPGGLLPWFGGAGTHEARLETVGGKE
jgi:hypothetical protein